MKQSKSSKNSKNTSKFSYLLSIVLWIAVWHIAATLLAKEIFLPTPHKVLSVLIQDLLPSEEFRLSVGNSLFHIGCSFLLGTLCGIIFAIFSYISSSFEILLWFPMKTIKSIPVASFVILILLWISSDKLSLVIPFLMVLPIIYEHTLSALQHTDPKLLEMSQIFRISRLKKILYIYIPEILPPILSAASLAIGMAWKSGVAAEIIGLVNNTIGNQLYQSKIYLMTPELFAWTIVIVTLSIICEKIIKAITYMLFQKESDKTNE